MKAILLAALFAIVTDAYAAAAEYWWITDRSETGITRQGNVRRACRVEASASLVRLLTEVDGKLVPYFESKNPGANQQLMMQLGYSEQAATPTYVPVGAGAYVALDQVASAEFQQTGGSEICILRGFAVELGRISNPKVIVRIRAKFAL
jgi:hypothetical protein